MELEFGWKINDWYSNKFIVCHMHLFYHTFSINNPNPKHAIFPIYCTSPVKSKNQQLTNPMKLNKYHRLTEC